MLSRRNTKQEKSEVFSKSHYLRLKALLSLAKEWCDQERGRQSWLARYLGVSRHTLNNWFRESKHEVPLKRPNAEQALALDEFLHNGKQ